MSLTDEYSLYCEGDHVLAMVSSRPDGERMLMITNFVRIGALMLLDTVFRFYGAGERMAGSACARRADVSFIVLLGFVLPQTLTGRDLVLVSVVRYRFHDPEKQP